MDINAFKLAQRFVGVSEVSGFEDNPMIMAMLKLDNDWPTNDEVPWCSAFVNFVAWMLRLPRSKSLRARSWLEIGMPTDRPVIGNDIVVLKRGGSNQPGPDVLNAPGHVGFYAGEHGFVDRGGNDRRQVLVLGGNQSNKVSIVPYDLDRVLGFRRLG